MSNEPLGAGRSPPALRPGTPRTEPRRRREGPEHEPEQDAATGHPERAARSTAGEISPEQEQDRDRPRATRWTMAARQPPAVEDAPGSEQAGHFRDLLDAPPEAGPEDPHGPSTEPRRRLDNATASRDTGPSTETEPPRTVERAVRSRSNSELRTGPSTSNTPRESRAGGEKPKRSRSRPDRAPRRDREPPEHPPLKTPHQPAGDARVRRPRPDVQRPPGTSTAQQRSQAQHRDRARPDTPDPSRDGAPPRIARPRAGAGRTPPRDRTAPVKP